MDSDLYLIEKILNPNENLIPNGPYCSTIDPNSKPNDKGFPKFIRCPYWRINKEKGNGAYCAYLEQGDYEDNGTLLLWDQVKECGVNDED